MSRGSRYRVRLSADGRLPTASSNLTKSASSSTSSRWTRWWSGGRRLAFQGGFGYWLSASPRRRQDDKPRQGTSTSSKDRLPCTYRLICCPQGRLHPDQSCSNPSTVSPCFGAVFWCDRDKPVFSGVRMDADAWTERSRPTTLHNMRLEASEYR